MDIKEIDKLITNKHEEYERNLPLWQRNYLAWLGGDDFKLQNLWPFEREEQEDFDDRLIRASYENMFADIIQRRQGLVFSRKIERRSNDYLLKLNQNIDGLGTCREEFIKKCFRLSQIFGFLPVLVENRVTASESSPRLVPVNPFNLINWQMDEDGFLLWILVKAKSHKESSGDKQEIYHYYDSQKIEVYRTKNQNRGFFSGKARKLEKIEELEHSMGVVPLTVLFDLKSDDGEFAGSSSLSDSCQLIIKLFNLNSWYDQLLYKTNYSTLAATPFHGSSDDMEIVIGAGDVLWVPEGCQMPQWIAPDTGPSEVFEKRISELRRRIYEMAELDPGFKENSRNVISGEAFSYQRKPVEEMALRLAGQLEEFENNIDRLILQCCARVNDPEPTVKYPNDYSQKSLADAISEIQTIEEVKSIPTKAREFLVSRILVSGRIAQLSEADGAYLKTIFENSEKRELMTSAEI